MESQIDDYDNTLMCLVLEIPRSSFYYYCKHNMSNRKTQDEKLKELIYKIWINSYKRYGTPKIINVLGKTQKLKREQKKRFKYY
jgi:hypothetical protein